MSSSKALKKKISKRAKQKKNILVKNSIRLKQKAEEAQTDATKAGTDSAEATDPIEKNTSALTE